MKKRSNIFIILLLIISFFSSLSISFNNVDDVGTITIEATKEKDIFSKASVIDISGVFIDGKFIEAKDIFSSGWEVGANGNITYNNESDKVSFDIPKGKIAELKLTGNSWRGVLKLHKLNKIYIYDTYADSAEADIRIDLNSSLNLVDFIKYFIGFVLLTTILFLILKKYKILDLEDKDLSIKDIIKEVALIVSFIVSAFVISIISNEKSSIIFSSYFLLFFYYSKYKLVFSNIDNESSLRFLIIRIYFTLGFIYYIYMSRFTYIYNIFCNIRDTNIRMSMVFIVFSFMICGLYVFMGNITSYIIYLFDDLIRKMDIFEKRYIISISILIIILLVFVYYNTSAFSYAYKIDESGNESRVWADVIYGLDHSWIISSYTDITNYERLYSIRHPLIKIVQLLLACMSLPFEIVLTPLFREINALVLAFFNSLFMIWTSVLLKRITKNYWIAIIYSISYFFIIFCLGTEQYQTSIFFIVLTLYLYQNFKYEKNYKVISSIMMSGTTLTSGVLIAILTRDSNIIKWFKKICFYCFYFFTFITLTGHLSIKYIQGATSLSKHVDRIPFYKSLCYFTYFVSDVFLYPSQANIVQKVYPDISMNVYTADIINYKEINIIGLLIIIVCIISIYKNYKDSLICICAYNIVISFILNVIIGWAQDEHWLYIILFSWSYLILVVKFIETFLKKYRNQTYILLVLVLAFVNFNELTRLFNFAVQYYIP